MKKTLLITERSAKTIFSLLVLCLCFNFSWSQNLMQNPTCDIHGTGSGSTTDNADAYDMTPGNDILDETGATIPSPYQAVWDNDALEDWLETQYIGGPGTLDEQPGSTSAGNNGTRGLKLYDDGNPDLNTTANTSGNLCSRRIYQRVNGLTVGDSYTFSVDSFSEAMGTPSEVYILNTEITDELGINANGGSDASVDGFLNVTNDFDVWTTSSFTFTASNTFAVVYIRSLSTTGGNDEVFYDNFSLARNGTASEIDFSNSNLKVYPNPAKDILTIQSTSGIEIESVEIIDVLGKRVLFKNNWITDQINVSDLKSGVYFLKVSSLEKSITRKIIIK